MEFCQYPSFHNPPIILSNTGYTTKGTLSTEADIAWICCNDILYSINRNDGQCLQLWKCSYGSIHSVKDVIYDDCQFLIVIVCTENDEYIIAILHASSFDIVKLISLSDKVTSIGTFESPGVSSNFTKVLINNGNLVIGCNGGRVYNINFNLKGSNYELVDRPRHIEVVEDYEDYKNSNSENAHCALLLTRVHRLLPPVIDFAYMEPEEDPRGFVYLWVAKGNAKVSTNQCLEQETKLTLYQMIYSSKYMFNGERYYNQFKACAPRLEYALTSSPTVPNPQLSTSSILYGCFTVDRLRSDNDQNPQRATGRDQDLSIVAFIWSSGVNNGSYYIAFFDINQWYQAQMPNVVRWRKSGKHTGVLGCSYLAFFSWNDLIQNDNDTLAVCISKATPFTPVSGCPVPETHLWPSSMKFSAVVLRKSNVSECTFLGLPRHALYELDLSRKIVYAQPEKVFNLCMKADLIQLKLEDDSQLLNLDVQRRYILDVIIDHNSPTRVMNSFIDGWLSSSSVSLFQLVRAKITDIKEEKESLCFSLQNSKILHLLERFSALQSFISHILSQINGLHNDIFSELVETFRCLSLQKKVIELLSSCVSIGFFDIALSDISRQALDCHRDSLVQTSKSPLAIDRICDEFQSSGISYPPSSPKDLMNIFLCSDVNAVHSYILYLFYDLELLRSEDFSDISRCTLLLSSPSHLVKSTKLFWIMDNLKDILHDKNMCSLFFEQTIFEWQHAFIMKKLLDCELNTLSLKYIIQHGNEMQSIDQVKLKIAAYITNGEVQGGYHIVKPFQNSLHHSELFHEVVKLCHQGKKFHILLQMHLCYAEEILLMQYISESGCPDLHELFVYYLLMDLRLPEAMVIYKSLVQSQCKEVSQNRVIEEYMKFLAPFFVDSMSEDPKTSKSFVDLNDCLFVNVSKPSKLKIVSQADMIFKFRSCNAVKPNTEVFSTISEGSSDSTFPSLVHLSETNSTLESKVHTPKVIIDKQPDSRFLSTFQARIYEFKDRIASKLTLSSDHRLANIDTPTTVQPCANVQYSQYTTPSKQHNMEYSQSLLTPTSILRDTVSTKKYSSSKTIRFVMDTPDRSMSNVRPGDTQITSQPDESSSDEFQSPSDSPVRNNFFSPVMKRNNFDSLSRGYINKSVTRTQDNELKVNDDQSRSDFLVSTSDSHAGHKNFEDNMRGRKESSPGLPRESTFYFSSPAKINSSTPSVNSSTPSVNSSTKLFAFSPPLTRSAARKSQSHHELSVSLIDDCKSKEKVRIDPVSLISPPSRIHSPSLSRTKKKMKADVSGIGIRRSTRLLKGKK